MSNGLPVHVIGNRQVIKIGITEGGGGSGKYPSYTGSYTITPKVSSIIVPTAKKSMEKDLTVLQIPYAETTNPGGGTTVTIGFE